ncbi:MAG: DUF4199 domain-containing protein [Opitutae bacterium]|nr:DUF4199 domain-containing protein [Opitutae bacterium]
MKNYALYGLINAVAVTLFSLLLYFTGLQTEHLDIGVHFQWLLAITSFVIIYLGVKEERETRPDQRMSYGSAFGGAVLISLVAGVLNSLYAYVHFSYVNTAFSEYMIQYQTAKMTTAGLPDSVIEQATTRTQNSFGPVRQAVGSGIVTVVSGAVYGLMLAPGQTQRGSMKRIAMVNGLICGFFGLLGGAANGFLTKSVGSSALIGLLGGGIGGWLITYLLLKFTNYTPRFANEEPM